MPYARRKRGLIEINDKFGQNRVNTHVSIAPVVYSRITSMPLVLDFLIHPRVKYKFQKRHRPGSRECSREGNFREVFSGPPWRSPTRPLLPSLQFDYLYSAPMVYRDHPTCFYHYSPLCASTHNHFPPRHHTHPKARVPTAARHILSS